MVEILYWTSIIAGGILVLLLLLSILGGLDLDLDVGSGDADVDSGGLGLIKGILTFVSVSSWVVKIILTNESHMWLALSIGIFSGIVAIVLLNYLLKLLISNEENVNWEMNDALFQKGNVYLKIPKSGSGIVSLNINGALRELKAKSKENELIKTGEKVVVVDVEGEFLLVRKDT